MRISTIFLTPALWLAGAAAALAASTTPRVGSTWESSAAESGAGNAAIIAITGFVGLLGLIFCIFVLKYLSLWIQAFFSNAHISFFQLIGMGFRKVNQRVIVTSKITLVQAGLNIETRQLEAHYLAGGTVAKTERSMPPMLVVVPALIAANRAGIPLDFNLACAIDLAGRDVLDAVRTSVDPKVIDCPDPSSGKKTIDAVAKNGIQVKAKARVTVRTNIAQLIGGATEETIIARVGEGIVSTIGSANSHEEVLENPDRISKQVLAKGLDAGTAYEILSIDIADVDIGDNIGAKLATDRAEADKRVAQAKAEERRAMAVAREQEMKALIQENRAKVVMAEAEVPKALAQTLREGNLGVMDYARLQNIQADTQMREAIAGDDEKPTPGGEGH
ncbi:MAG: flotillin-like protein FloA [Planctomycetes bacterium]|nr:flotillin-like protein FloA [Planctomycetota bacterium]